MPLWTHRYDQKQVLRAAVLAFVRDKNIRSLLDIGAGAPDPALWYASSVPRYLAVELNCKRAAKLRRAGVPVNRCRFPCDVPSHYDLVLASHSLPEQRRNYEPFLAKAWEVVAPNGHLMIFTFKGVIDPLIEMHANLRGIPVEPCDREKFDAMMQILQRIGEPQLSTVVSTEISENPDDITASICFSLGDESPQAKHEISRRLHERFRVETEYQFPHTHNVIVMQKGAIQE
jgi:hypothetical protein